jgi:hypothetical protein
MMKTRVTALLALALLAGCTPTEEAADGWLRSVGTVDAAASSVPVLMLEPQPLRAGSVTAVVSTYGNAGCVRAGDTRVSVDKRAITITPYDYVAPRGTVCGQGFVRLVHEATLDMRSSGAWTIRVQARRADGRLETITWNVDVLP